MTPDEGILYNKFHIISVGLRNIQRKLNHFISTIPTTEISKANEIVEILMKESDNGMKHILDMAGEKMEG